MIGRKFLNTLKIQLNHGDASLGLIKKRGMSRESGREISLNLNVFTGFVLVGLFLPLKILNGIPFDVNTYQSFSKF